MNAASWVSKLRKRKTTPAIPDDAAATSGGFEDTAGAAYAALVEEQLEEERLRKTSLEQRGSFVITSSGALATLLFALGALVTSRQTFSAPPVARIVLSIAVMFFFLAALGGLLANLPWRYEEAAVASLRRLLDDRWWTGRKQIGVKRTTEVNIAILRRARSANRRKAIAVRLGLAAEVVAVAFVSIAVVIVLSS